MRQYFILNDQFKYYFNILRFYRTYNLLKLAKLFARLPPCRQTILNGIASLLDTNTSIKFCLCWCETCTTQRPLPPFTNQSSGFYPFPYMVLGHRLRQAGNLGESIFVEKNNYIPFSNSNNCLTYVNWACQRAHFVGRFNSYRGVISRKNLYYLAPTEVRWASRLNRGAPAYGVF